MQQRHSIRSMSMSFLAPAVAPATATSTSPMKPTTSSSSLWSLSSLPSSSSSFSLPRTSWCSSSWFPSSSSSSSSIVFSALPTSSSSSSLSSSDASSSSSPSSSWRLSHLFTYTSIAFTLIYLCLFVYFLALFVLPPNTLSTLTDTATHFRLTHAESARHLTAEEELQPQPFASEDCSDSSRPASSFSSPLSRSSSSPATLRITSLIPSSSLPTDSTADLYIIRGRGELGTRHDEVTFCTFTNIVPQPKGVLFRFANRTLHEHWRDQFERCNTGDRQHAPPICRACFHPGYRPGVLPYEYDADWSPTWSADNMRQHRLYPDPFVATEESTTTTTTKSDADAATTSAPPPVTPLANGRSPFAHVWSMHKWVRHHHIAHWAQKLLVFQSIFQHSHLFTSSSSSSSDRLPPIDGFLLHDTDAPLTAHEEFVFNASIAAALGHVQPPSPYFTASHAERLTKRTVWGDALDAQFALGAHNYTGFARMSMTPHYGVFSFNSEDTSRFREIAYAQAGLAPPMRCPPKRAVLLYRHNRRMINQQAVMDVVSKEFHIPIEAATINEESTPLEQISLFAGAGLLLSSHSSQMINVMFSPPGGAMIEVSAEFYNADFSEYANGIGVFFQYALGGQVPDGKPQPEQRECVDRLAVCEGASHCILEERFRCRITETPNKPLNFVANLTAVRIAVRHSLVHLNWMCDGHYLQARGGK